MVKTVDVKGLEHGEREKLIFPSIEQLEAGETLRIVVEFNPVPLVYMLNAQGGFEVAYEKEGPAEWILKVTKTGTQKDVKSDLKTLLTELKGGEVSEETKVKAKELFQTVDAKTLGLVEQELIREGVSHDEIRKSLCDIHLEALKDTLISKRIEVTAPHPVHTFTEEHKVILESLRELGQLVSRLKEKSGFESMGNDLNKLKEIAHHLVDAENHHQREEEVLFPKLEKHDVIEPPSIMKMDHVEFRKCKKELYKIAHNYQDYNFPEFKTKVNELGGYLSQELASHIFKEDNILYQIALQVLTPEEWEEVKRECDKIGYCCFTPEDQKGGTKTVELDLRPIPIFERHDKIFERWNSLKPGETLKITNDHDPKPLRYQFMVEYKDQFEWEYLQEGPKDWVVNIKRTASAG